jgi:hypothetical protein
MYVNLRHFACEFHATEHSPQAKTSVALDEGMMATANHDRSKVNDELCRGLIRNRCRFKYWPQFETIAAYERLS